MNHAQAQLSCLHCGNSVNAGASFCCEGCHSVYELLNARGLGHFYDLQKLSPVKKAIPLINADALASIPTNKSAARFYLEGIHCLGCLWLLEKLPELDPRIKSASLDYLHQILSVEIDSAKINWNEVIALVRDLGYPAKYIQENGLPADRKKHHAPLIRIGVAGFCAGNIMLLSVSVYSGADAFWSLRFGWLSFILALPVFLYSAAPLFRAAFLPLLKKRISVDLAIVLALICGMGMSVWSLAAGEASLVYFDSLTMLVFLLLSTRYLLDRLRQNIANETPYLSFLYNEKYQLQNQGGLFVKANEIKPGDLFILKNGQTLPVDSTIQDSAHFDLSLLNGESRPVKMQAGDKVDSGAILLSPEAKLQANNLQADSRMAKITSQIHSMQMKRSPTLDLAERVGRYFVVIVLLLCASVVYVVPGIEGFHRALALAIVTCPCVLAFAIPLCYARVMQIAARKGILFKNPEKIEALAEAQNIFLDKTGTLTNGNFEVLSWQNILGEDAVNKRMAFTLESRSVHPVGKAIARFLRQDIILPLEEFSEIAGMGVRAKFENKQWEMRAHDSGSAKQNQVGLFCDGELRSLINLGDKIRDEAQDILVQLRKLGLKPHLLSGDHTTAVSELAAKLKIEDWHSMMLPEQKAKILANSPLSIMVGDGANDGIAFHAASVSIAMQGAMDLSLKNADISFTRPGLKSLPYLIELAATTRRLVRVNFSFTLFYNIIAGYLAITGKMQPMLAAILMPLSAFTVFLFTHWQTRRLK